MSRWPLLFLLYVSLLCADAANLCPATCQCNSNQKSAVCIGKNLKDVPKGLSPDIEILRLEGNSLTNLSALSLQKYRNLKTLDVRYNKLVHVSPDAFANAPHLEVLNLQGNQLTVPPVAMLDMTNQLRELNLGENKIREIPTDAFSRLGNLRTLDLRSNSIQNIPNGAFGALTILHQLDLSSNGLSNITARNFMGLRSLTRLSLARNKITNVQNTAFQELPNLEVLDLSDNAITEFELGTSGMLGKLNELKLNGNKMTSFEQLNFTRLPQLRELYLGHNWITEIPPHLFKYTKMLEVLYLDHQPYLRFIDYRALCGLQSLRVLDLSNNKELATIDKSLFVPTKSLETINLSHNNFSSFYQEAFMHLANLRSLLIDGNPLNCDCAAKWLQELSNSTQLPALSSGIQCAMPEAFRNYSISEMPRENMTCVKPEILNYTQNAFFKIGSQAVLKCLVSGEPVPSVTWITPLKKVFKHNDYLSNAEDSDVTHYDIISDHFHSDHHWHDSVNYFHNTSHDRIQILANGDLYIDYVQRKDAGPYTCITTNPGGNDTVVIRFRLNYLAFNKIKLTSLIVGFGGAGAFFGLALLLALLRYLCNRCEKKERMERKTRTIRKLLENLEAYKTHQLDKLKDNYSLQVTKIKEQAFFQMEKMRENYNMQLQKIRDNCAGQMDKLRDNYNTQMGKIKGYSSHQIEKIRENYNSQMIKIRDYGSVQLEKLRETYKLQHQHLIKILEAMNIDHCRGVMVDTDCLRTDSVLFDQLQLEHGLDLPDSKPASRISISDDEFVTAISDAEGISLDALTGVTSENISLGNFEDDIGSIHSLDRASLGSGQPNLANYSQCNSSDARDPVPDATESLMSNGDFFTSVDLNDDIKDNTSSSLSSINSSPSHHVVEIKPETLSISQVETNI